MYGLKPDVFDITKLVNELPLHDLLSGNYTSPTISKDKGKKSASSNNDLMQSVRKACSVLQAQKGLQVQNCPEIDNSCIRSDSTGLITVNSTVGQTDVDKGDNCTPLLLSPDEVSLDFFGNGYKNLKYAYKRITLLPANGLSPSPSNNCHLLAVCFLLSNYLFISLILLIVLSSQITNFMLISGCL